ncbi:hypothetical protein PF008_g28387 [Phytophthora fragariae]|uniref:BZIP domain-containing protein n=1 Tax=Phytophthora fragariae TaxID=53985 RepID=A0A6G0QC94_9STRA|nr:hypothetical protein PF008_g28387 [Phytophthora fragariae]
MDAEARAPEHATRTKAAHSRGNTTLSIGAGSHRAGGSCGVEIWPRRGSPVAHAATVESFSERLFWVLADPVTLKALRVLQQIKRERRRVSQQKYMKKKSRAAADLEKYMPLLRDEVRQLQTRQSRLVGAKKTLWSAAV